MVTALLFTPWATQVRLRGVEPRALADDLLVTATGPNHETQYKHAYQDTLKYIKDIGGAVAVDKCTGFSTSRATRARIRIYPWEHLDNTTVSTITQARDLG